MEVVTKSSAETKKLGRILAREALKTIRENSLPHALVISLEGNLGSGKTTFTQGFARGLGIKEKILSPTFILIKRYRFSHVGIFFHIDCYRLRRGRDLETLGFSDILANPRAIVLIEWGDRIRTILPRRHIRIIFSHRKRNVRGVQMRFPKLKDR